MKTITMDLIKEEVEFNKYVFIPRWVFECERCDKCGWTIGYSSNDDDDCVAALSVDSSDDMQRCYIFHSRCFPVKKRRQKWLIR